MEEQENDFETQDLELVDKSLQLVVSTAGGGGGGAQCKRVGEVGLLHVGHESGPDRPSVTLIGADILSGRRGEKLGHEALYLREEH